MIEIVIAAWLSLVVGLGDAMKIIWQFPFTYRYGDGKFHAHIN